MDRPLEKPFRWRLALWSLAVGLLAVAVARESWGALTAEPKPKAVAGAAIPQVEGSLEWDSVAPFYRSWFQNKAETGYDAHGTHDPRWDGPARKFVMGALVAKAFLRERPSEDQLAAWSLELQRVGCPDPLVAATFALREEGKERRRSLLLKAEEGLRTSTYAPAFLFLVRVELWKLLRESNRQAADELVPGTVAALKKEWEAAPLSEGDYWAWDYFSRKTAFRDFLKAHGEPLLAAVDPLPTVEPWFKHLLRGFVEHQAAWVERGNNSASGVSPSGWKGFAEHLALSRQELTDAWRLHPQHPGAASLMVAVAMGDSSMEEMRQWFDRAVSARLDCPAAYSNLLWGLRPRWGGSHEAMLSLGKACAETKRFDIEVPWQYFIAAHDAAHEGSWEAKTDFFLNHCPYADLRELCLTYSQTKNAPRHPTYYLSHLAMLAAACGHRQDALDALKQLGFKLDSEAAYEWDVSPERWAEKWLCENGPASVPAMSAEMEVRKGEFSKGIEIWRQAVSQPDFNPDMKDFVEAQIATLQKLQPLEKAAWSPFFPAFSGSGHREKNGWICRGGSWTQLDPKTLEISGGLDTQTILHSTIPAGGVYELRGEFEFITRPQPKCSVAITVGWPEDALDTWRTLRFDHWGPSVNNLVVGEAMSSGQSFSVSAESRTSFFIRVVGNRMSVRVSYGAAEEFEFRPPGDISGWPPVLGFAVPRANQPVTVRFYDVQWRRLTDTAR